jgi:multidrug efflux pump
VIRDGGGIQVRIRDVAKVELAPASERIVTRFNGRPSVSLGVIRQSTANALDLSVAGARRSPRSRRRCPRA